MAYETEVFCECGAWKSITELEESLLLYELMELYSTTVERQTRLIHTMASIFGAEPSSEGGNLGDETNTVVVYGEEDIARLPFGLGYETVSGEG